MNDSYEQVLIEDQAQWRAWLDAHRDTSPGIWLVTGLEQQRNGQWR